MSERRVAIDVAAAPAVIYDLLADVTRMPDWSPEVIRCTWVGRVTEARAGARFRGWSRKGWRRWSTMSTISRADRPACLEWQVRFWRLPVASWQYRIDRDGERGTTVTETVIDQRGRLLRLLSPYITGSRDRDARNDETMRATLDRLKAAAEASVRSR